MASGNLSLKTGEITKNALTSGPVGKGNENEVYKVAKVAGSNSPVITGTDNKTPNRSNVSNTGKPAAQSNGAVQRGSGSQFSFGNVGLNKGGTQGVGPRQGSALRKPVR